METFVKIKVCILVRLGCSELGFDRKVSSLKRRFE